MFTKQWDAVWLTHISQQSVPGSFCKNISGAQRTISTSYTQYMTVLGGTNSTSGSSTDFNRLVKPNGTYGGVFIGTGNTPPTYEDYAPSGDFITTFEYTCVLTKTNTDKGIQLSSKFTITNTGTEAFTIGEVGLITSSGNSANQSTKIMLERTVLDTPITIEAGGVGQLTYTININMPS